MRSIWHIELLGTLQAKSEFETISRFRTRRVGLILAYLALFSNQSHSREELAFLLWPEEDEEVARRNLRQALSSLRRHLEPPPLPHGSVLTVKQSNIGLNVELVTTDVGEFEKLAKRASKLNSADARMDALEQALSHYKGVLLPGVYADWVQSERQRLEDEYVAALKGLAKLAKSTGKAENAVSHLRLALAKEPLDEELHTALISLYLETGRPTQALRQYTDLENALEAELNCKPGREAQELSARARSAGASRPPEEPIVAERLAQEPHEAPLAIVARPKQVQLPVRLTRFHGRSKEIETVLGLLLDESSRLVSLVGPAGVGKTRLSHEASARLGEQFDWNVWFVPLADISSGTMLLDTIADVLNARRDERLSALDQIKLLVKGTQNLIVLDNLEHILESVAPEVRYLLAELPGAKFLATSRQSLKIEGEREIEIEPLPFPNPGATADALSQEALAELSQFPSIQLFINRCQSIHPDYQLTVNNARTVSAICERLEGLPLALEIGAGLTNAFTAGQLLQNLDNRLDILKNRRRDAISRHRSLRAAIDYSYELLSPELQRFFSALSVFRGGFTISAADRICAGWIEVEVKTAVGKRRQQERCLRMLLDLQERSLLRADDALASQEARFRLMEAFREYGREQLSQSEEESLQERHALYYYELVRKAAEISSREVGLMVRAERDNVSAALQTLTETGRLEETIRLLDYSGHRGPGGRSRQMESGLVQRLVGDPRLKDVPGEHVVTLQRMLANIALYDGDYEAAEIACGRALDIARAIDSPQAIAISYNALAVVYGYRGDNEKALEY